MASIVDRLDDARSVMLDPGRVFFSGYAKFSCFPFLFHWKRLPFLLKSGASSRGKAAERFEGPVVDARRLCHHSKARIVDRLMMPKRSIDPGLKTL